jgi:hypothetical protein
MLLQSGLGRGGISWQPIDMGRACNKIRIYTNEAGQTYGYSIGVEVFQLQVTPPDE